MTIEEQDREIIRTRLLGRGPALEHTMPGLDVGLDLALAQSEAGTDLAFVDGIDNLLQDLRVALTTLVGSDVFNTEFGFDGLNAMVEETNPVLIRERVRIAVIQVLRRDPRIRRIVDVHLEDLGAEEPTVDRLQMPEPGSRELDVQVRFETITGDQLTASIGKVPRHG